MRPSDVVARRVEAVRRRYGWSQKHLAERLGALGVERVDRSTIAKIEAGTRAVTVDELSALAVALDVSPMALMVPSGYLPTEDGDEGPGAWNPAPRKAVDDPWRAVQWFRGTFPLSTDAESAERFEAGRPHFERDARDRLPEMSRLLDYVTIAVRRATMPLGNGPNLDNLLADIEDILPDAVAEVRRAHRAGPAKNPLDYLDADEDMGADCGLD